MKKLSILLFILFSINLYSAEVKEARINDGFIEIDVVYGGGCKDHKFILEMQGCLESMPVQCTAKLVDKTFDDFCEAMLSETVKISIKKERLDEEYYAGGSLTIKGDGGSAATVTLP